MDFAYVTQQRPVTDELREAIASDLPELSEIADEGLRRLAIEAWAYSLTRSSFRRISDLPGEGNPGVSVLKQGSQVVHLRGVAHLALRIAGEFLDSPGVEIDKDVILTGALCHDVGKPYEFDRGNIARWDQDPSVSGQPALRHSVYGAHVCLAVGLPEQIAHIALGHSLEGQHIGLSAECMVVRHADHVWWQIAGAVGLLEPASLAQAGPMLRPRIRPRVVKSGERR
ncbi:MAG: HD domain-containing protein [Stellaceae bacterium]